MSSSSCVTLCTVSLFRGTYDGAGIVSSTILPPGYSTTWRAIPDVASLSVKVRIPPLRTITNALGVEEVEVLARLRRPFEHVRPWPFGDAFRRAPAGHVRSTTVQMIGDDSEFLPSARLNCRRAQLP